MTRRDRAPGSSDSPETRPAERFWWSDEDFATGARQQLYVERLHGETTPYQRLEVLESELFGRVLALDGIVQTTTADEFIYHEMIVNVPLCGRVGAGEGRPASVLVIGGGDGGALREVLTHDPVERAVMVEIDRAVVDATAKHVGIQADYEDRRVELRIEDGNAFVHSADARSSAFDVVIIDSTDPVGPGEALFTDEFMAAIGECMADDGVMVRQSGLPFFQGPELTRVSAQARRVFGSAEVFLATIPSYYGGAMAFVVGNKSGGTLREPGCERTGRHYNPGVHRAAFALPTWIGSLVEAPR